MARQLETVHRELAWAELDRRLGVRSRIWTRKRYTLLARELCVLATMHEYWRQRWPNAAGPANTPAGEKVRTLSRAMVAGWRSVRDYLELLGISWKIDIVSRLTESGRIAEGLRGESKKALYRDHHGGVWLIKYDDESILNPVLATIFSRLTGCPGAELCPVFLDYDPRSGQPCSVQPYLKAERIRRFAWCSRRDYSALFGGNRLRASQALCQSVHEWLLGNSDGYQVIIDVHGNSYSSTRIALFSLAVSRVRRREILRGARPRATQQVPWTIKTTHPQSERRLSRRQWRSVASPKIMPNIFPG